MAYPARASPAWQSVPEDVGDRPERQPARRIVAPGQRQLEPELVEAVPPPEVPEPQAPETRPERGLDRRLQAGDHRLRVPDPHLRPALGRHDRFPELGVEVVGREVDRLEDPVDQRPHPDPARHPPEDRRRLVGDQRLLGLAPHPGVGPDPPGESRP